MGSRPSSEHAAAAQWSRHHSGELHVHDVSYGGAARFIDLLSQKHRGGGAPTPAHRHRRCGCRRRRSCRRAVPRLGWRYPLILSRKLAVYWDRVQGGRGAHPSMRPALVMDSGNGIAGRRTCRLSRGTVASSPLRLATRLASRSVAAPSDSGGRRPLHLAKILERLPCQSRGRRSSF
jgi:hypothetical protein